METLTSDLVTQELDQLAFWKSNKAFYPPALSFLISRSPPPLSPSAQVIPSHSPYLDEVPFIFKEKQGPHDADDGGEELLQRGLEKERQRGVRAASPGRPCCNCHPRFPPQGWTLTGRIWPTVLCAKAWMLAVFSFTCSTSVCTSMRLSRRGGGHQR